MSSTTATMGLKKPDMSDTFSTLVSDIQSNMDFIDKFYPIGTIYQSTNATDPSTFIGGRWSRLQDRMLIGAGTTFAAASTGGEKEHTLAVNELPSVINFQGINDGTTVVSDMGQYNPKIYQDKDANWIGKIKIPDSGKAHNNMPPYLAVYMWVRTA